MSIESAIANKQQQVADCYTTISNKGGTLPATQNLTNMPTAINSIVTAPTIDSLSVTPTTSAQTITAPSGTDGYSPVNVAAVTSSIDANIVAGNIKNGVSILGVTGNYSGSGTSPVITSLSVTPTTSAQTISVPAGTDGYSPVNVAAVTSSIDANIVAGNIKSGVTILGVSGTITELNGETQSVSLTSSSGNTFTPSTGKNGITSITVTPTNEARTVTPATSQQTLSVNSGYSGNGTVTVAAVDNTIDANIVAGNIKSGVTILGVNGSYAGITPTGTINISANGTYDVTNYATANVSGFSLGVPREVSQGGVYQMPSSSFTFTLPSNATVLGKYSLYSAFYYCSSLTSVDLSSLTTISGVGACENAFYRCESLVSIDLSNLTTISSTSAMSRFCEGCSSLTNVDLSSLTTVSSMSRSFLGCSALTNLDLSSVTTIESCSAMLNGCTSLTSVNLSSLTSITGTVQAFATICDSCRSLTSFDLSSLATIQGSQVFYMAFRNCASLTTLSFPSLNSQSFGTNTNQFNSMLSGVTGCTVHFPSNLSTVINTWSDVIAGFGGTNTTVLFDLPATS